MTEPQRGKARVLALTGAFLLGALPPTVGWIQQAHFEKSSRHEVERLSGQRLRFELLAVAELLDRMANTLDTLEGDCVSYGGGEQEDRKLKDLARRRLEIVAELESLPSRFSELRSDLPTLPDETKALRVAASMEQMYLFHAALLRELRWEMEAFDRGVISGRTNTDEKIRKHVPELRSLAEAIR